MFDWSSIRRFHMSYRIDGVAVTQSEFVQRRAVGDGKNFEDPWKNIGYHYGIEFLGYAYEIVLGRFAHEVGAHCKDMNMNESGIGICLLGNFDKREPNDDQWKKAKGLVSHLMLSYEIPKKNVVGHREVQAMAGIPLPNRKTCPGNMWDMDKFRNELYEPANGQ